MNSTSCPSPAGLDATLGPPSPGRIEELERLALVAQCGGDGAALADEAGRITWVNDSFVRVTGFPAAEAMSRTPRELLTGPETRDETIAALERALATHATWLGEM